MARPSISIAAWAAGSLNIFIGADFELVVTAQTHHPQHLRRIIWHVGIFVQAFRRGEIYLSRQRVPFAAPCRQVAVKAAKLPHARAHPRHLVCRPARQFLEKFVNISGIFREWG